MARGAASRATVHRMAERQPTRHRTLRALVRPG